MKRYTLTPFGWPCRLAECPPGPFRHGDGFGFRTEYGFGNVIEVFCLDTGEVFCGKANNLAARAGLIVQPCVGEWEEYDE